MKRMFFFSKKFELALLLVPVMLVLSGCNPFGCCKNKTSSVDSSAVLVSMKGHPVITMDSFEREFKQLVKDNPHLESVLSLMPDAKKNFLMGMVNQEVVDHWVTENKVDQKLEYAEEYERMMRSVRRMLNTKFFGLEHPVKISDSELTEFYEKNKDSMADLMISRGGVQAAGVSFDRESDARVFVAKVKEVEDLKKAADVTRLSKHYRDFKMVNAQSVGMDATLRDRIVALTKVPALEVVKVSDKSFWVVSATHREDTKYRPLEQVKAGLEQFVAKEKRMEMFEKEISKLKTDFAVVVNRRSVKASTRNTSS